MPKRLLHLRPWRRHSIVLFGAGLIYIAFGMSMSVLRSTGSREAGLNLAVNVMPLWAWGFVWMLVGVMALASTRWPPQSETWGYGAMGGLAALWGAFYLLGMPFRVDWEASVPGTLVFFLLTYMWWAVSGLMNPDDPEPHKPVVFDWSIYAPTHREPRKQLTDQPSQRTPQPFQEE